MNYFYKILATSIIDYNTKDGKPLKAEDALSIYIKFLDKYKVSEIQDPMEEPDVFALTFYDENDHSLTITPCRDGCFNVVYENKTQYANLMLSNDINENPENISPEDYIVWFFANEMETRLSPEAFCEKSDNSDEEKTLSFGPRNNSFGKCIMSSIMILLLSVMFIFIVISTDPKIKTTFIPLIASIFIFSVSIPGFVLWFNYSRVNRKSTFHIRKNDNQFLYCDWKRQTEFNAKDIKSVIHVHVQQRTNSINKVWNSFEYLEFNLKNADSIYITCYMADVSEIVSSLKLKTENKLDSFPVVKRHVESGMINT